MENQKPEMVIWKLDFETEDNEKLHPQKKEVISRSFQIITTRLSSMGMMGNVSKILLTKEVQKKVAIEVVKDVDNKK